MTQRLYRKEVKECSSIKIKKKKKIKQKYVQGLADDRSLIIHLLF